MPKASKADKVTKLKAKAVKADKAAKATKLYSTFLPLPVTIPTASSSKSAKPHNLYVRAHKSTPAHADDGRTLFVANIPVDAEAHALRTLFTRWGVVEAVEMAAAAGGDVLEAAVRGIEESDDESDDEDEEAAEEETEEVQNVEPTFLGTGGPTLPRSQRKRRKPNTLPPSVPVVAPLPAVPTAPGVSGYASCRVVFVDGVSVSRVLAYSGPALSLPIEGTFGLSFFEAQYATLRPALALVREHADTAMARYDHLHSLLLSSRAKAQGAGALVDEDGFTVVVRGGRYGRTAGRAGDPGSGGGVAVASHRPKVDDGKKKGRGSGPLDDFYKFQIMDKKRKGELLCAGSAVLTDRTRRHARTLRRGQEKGRGAQDQQAVPPILAVLDVDTMYTLFSILPHNLVHLAALPAVIALEYLAPEAHYRPPLVHVGGHGACCGGAEDSHLREAVLDELLLGIWRAARVVQYGRIAVRLGFPRAPLQPAKDGHGGAQPPCIVHRIGSDRQRERQCGARALSEPEEVDVLERPRLAEIREQRAELRDHGARLGVRRREGVERAVETRVPHVALAHKWDAWN
jgi:ribosomal RNA-processing protein 7